MQQQLQHSHLHQHQHQPHPHQHQLHIHNNQPQQRYETQTQIRAYEGLYRQIPMSDYSCPNRVTYSNNSISSPIRLSFVTLPDLSANSERICFNYGRELFIYVYKGVKKTPDLKKLVEKKVYKGINPTCHDFNRTALTDGSALLLVGLSSGQIQLIDPIQKDVYKIFNEDRLIEKTKVTCIRWIPRSKNEFLVSHASGNLYVYHADLPCYSTIPSYQIHKEGSGFQIQASKSKIIRNPIYRWSFPTDEDCCINEFAFSPCGSFLAIVSQDGFLRVFDFEFMELQGFARSYFGGFLCVCWSPDSRYIVVGGQDDLVTVWSFHDKCVLARGQAHKSWVSVVAFDPFMTSAVTTTAAAANNADFMNDSGITFDNEDLTTIDNEKCPKHNQQNHKTDGRVSSNASSNICYRFGSVGQDTQLCLWDITEDILNPAFRSTYRNCSESTSIPTSMTAQTPVVITPSSTPTPTLTTATASISAIAATQPSTLSLSATAVATDEQDGDGSSSATSPAATSAPVPITTVTKTTSDVSLTTAICSKSTSVTTTSNSTNIVTPILLNSNSTDSGCDTTEGGSQSRSKHKKSSTSGSKENHFSIIGNISSLTQKLKVFNFNERKSEKKGGGGGGGGGAGSTNANLSCNSNSKGSQRAHAHTHTNASTSLNANTNSNKTTHSTKRIDQSLSLSSSSCTNQNSHSSSNSNSNSASCCSSKDGSLLLCDPLRVIGTSHCPRFDQCPIIEPLVCEKIAHECLTALVFREDCFVTACQDGCIYTWARPNKINVNGDMFCRYETD